MAIRVNFALSEQKIHQNIFKKQNQNSLLIHRVTLSRNKYSSGESLDERGEVLQIDNAL
jgi:hypothetical protein